MSTYPTICARHGKFIHRNRAAAMKSLRSWNGKPQDARGGQHAYRCGHCGGWHVGHAVPKIRDARKNVVKIA